MVLHAQIFYCGTNSQNQNRISTSYMKFFLQLYNHVVFSTNYAAFMNFTETVFHISKFYCLWVFFACLPISVLPVDIRISRHSKLLSAQSCSADCAVECCHVL